MSSNWIRVHGEGEPTDYSAGSSVEGDWTGPPVLRLVEPSDVSEATPEPIEAVEPAPDAPEPDWWQGGTPMVRDHTPPDAATGWRLLVKFIHSRQENR
jgi:hypothetical protein